MVRRSVHLFGRRALEMRQMGYSQALLALIMSATLVRGALWCDNGGSKTTYIDRNLTMHPDDLRALEVFRDGLNDTDRLLANWNASSHPCEWCGVLCMCEEQLYPPYDFTGRCPEGGRYNDTERVFGIDIVSGVGLGLAGPLPTEIGLLTEAKLLYLPSNSLTGTIPSEMGRLSNLVRLILRHNAFTGTLPPELGDARMKDLILYHNQLEGTVPPSYCDLVTAEGANPLVSLVIAINTGLCGELPACLTPAIHAGWISQTCIVHPWNPKGGVCDKTGPECAKVGGCLSTPLVSNRVDLLQFNASGFEDAQSGIKAIRWHLGTQPGLNDAMVETMNLPPDQDTFFYNSSTVQLVHAMRYYVTVTVVNAACPEVTTVFISSAILIDTTPPEPVEINGRDAIYMSEDCTHVKQQQGNSHLFVCWEEFVEKESNVSKYEVQYIRADSDGSQEVMKEFSSDRIVCFGGFCQTDRRMDLLAGSFYSVTVRAFNTAGSSKDVQSTDLLIMEVNRHEHVEAGSMARVLMIVGAMIFVVFTVMAYKLWSKRLNLLRKKFKSLRDREALAKDLQETYEACTCEDAYAHARTDIPGDIFTLEEVVFVFTDIQDSTSMSAFDSVAQRYVMDIHDSVIEHHIALNNGYEMNTQGDSFEIAFSNVQSATRFCLAVQMDLLHAAWHKSVLRLPFCGEVRGANGKLLFAGPRVRMGIHLAEKGSFSIRRHHLTKHIQFHGQGVRLAAMLGDSAAGGQIVMSESTLYSNERAVMKQAVLKLLGQFRFHIPPNDKVQVAVYSVLPPPLGRMPARNFGGPLRGCDMVEAGEGLQLVPPPTFKKEHGLTVVLIHLETTEPKVVMAVDLQAASCAQQFHGYQLLPADPRELVYMFQTSIEAVHFGMILQVALMAARWEDVSPEQLRIERNQQGKVIFCGPRVSLLVHCSRDILMLPSSNNSIPSWSQARTLAESQLARQMTSISFNSTSSINLGIEDGEFHRWSNSSGASDPGGSRRHVPRLKKGQTSREPRRTRASNLAEYSGEGLRDADILSALVHPGQLVVTEAVWKVVQGNLPVLAQVISLGVHEVPDLSDIRPQTLTEISASCISQRTFPPVPSRRCLVPGYRQAPEVHEDLTCMFCNVMSCPTAPAGVDQQEFMKAYEISVKLYCKLVRRLVTQFNGYECKEPERGKITLAFKYFKHAVAFAVTVQSALMGLEYPSILLEAEECAEVRLEADDTLLYRGLRVKIGMAHGRASLKKPIRSTGRADYYGILANTAARLMSVAPPGQVLTDGTNLHNILDESLPDLTKLHQIQNLREESGTSHTLRMSDTRDGKSHKASKASLLVPSVTPSVTGTVTSTEWFGSSIGSRMLSSLVEAGNSREASRLPSEFDLSMGKFECVFSPVVIQSGPPLGALFARGYGMYKLNGVPTAMPLVQLSMAYLAGRKLPPNAERA